MLLPQSRCIIICAAGKHFTTTFEAAVSNLGLATRPVVHVAGQVKRGVSLVLNGAENTCRPLKITA